MPPFVFIFVWLMQYSRRTRQRTLIRLFSITRLFLSLLVYYGREPYMMHGSIGVFLLKGEKGMSIWWVLLIIVVWLVLQAYVLPKLGIST